MKTGVKGWFLIVFLMLLALSGCSSDAPEQSEKENVYMIYYAGAEAYSLVTENREITGNGIQELAVKMLEEMGKPQQVGNTSLFTASGLVRRIYLEGENLVNIYMTEEYSKLAVADEVLLRAGIVKTLTQLEGLDYVAFYVDEQPLTDATGKAVGVMSADSFLDSGGEVLSNYQQILLTLYFGDTSGNNLIETERESTISSSFSQERQVVNALLEGPEDSSLLGTMPVGTSLISVSVRDKICYVNFNNNFLTGDLAVNPYVTIYSLVNSLTELPTINKVQIMVDGDSSKRFRESIPLDIPFERNLDYIVTGGIQS